MNARDDASSPTISMIYADHHAWLHGWLWRRLGNAADAADLAHDAFLRLLDNLPRFQNAPAARGYLRSMANGLCVDLWRRRSLEQAWLDTLAAQPESMAPSAEHQAIVLETLQEIDALLRNLPQKAAQAFVMAVACEMSYQEVAHELGVSVRMVAKYVAKATLHCLHIQMRQTIEELPHGGPYAGKATLPAAVVC